MLGETEGEAGALLWLAYREVMLWARSPPVLRRSLFPRSAAERRRRQVEMLRIQPEIRALLRACAEVLDGEDASARAIADAAAQFAWWAVEQGRWRTASAFAQLAAVLEPDSAAHAQLAARFAVGTGRDARAETWFVHAAAAADAAGDVVGRTGAFAALAWIAAMHGERLVAAQCLREALRGHGLEGDQP